jgi:hypothetical protein
MGTLRHCLINQFYTLTNNNTRVRCRLEHKWYKKAKKVEILPTFVVSCILRHARLLEYIQPKSC